MGTSYYHRVQKYNPEIMQKRRDVALKYYYNIVKNDEIKYVTNLVSSYLYRREHKKKRNRIN